MARQSQAWQISDMHLCVQESTGDPGRPRVAQESPGKESRTAQGRPAEPRKAEENPGEPRRAQESLQDSPGEPRKDTGQPRRAKESPGELRRGPGEPRRAQESPGELPGEPRRGPGEPRRAQESPGEPRRAQKRPRRGQGRPRRAQESPGDAFCVVFCDTNCIHWKPRNANAHSIQSLPVSSEYQRAQYESTAWNPANKRKESEKHQKWQDAFCIVFCDTICIH